MDLGGHRDLDGAGVERRYRARFDPRVRGTWYRVGLFSGGFGMGHCPNGHVRSDQRLEIVSTNKSKGLLLSGLLVLSAALVVALAACGVALMVWLAA